MLYQLTPKIRGLILDMDGVLWKDDQPIGILPEIFNRISHLGLKVMFCTNNSTLTVESYQAKFHNFGVTIETSQIITSSIAAAEALKSRLPFQSRIYVIGENGLIQTLKQEGFYPAETDVQAVVAGLDRFVTYEKLKKGALFVRNGAIFIGTNPDRTLPTPEGLIPGAGTIIAALETATDSKAIVVGKPDPFMTALALQRLGLKAQETLVVGDRVETDIAAGQAVGCRTALVFSGVSTSADLQKWSPQPDLTAPSLEYLFI